MPDLSIFESRTGKLTCNPQELYDFVTDIRNFRQFMPEGTINELDIEKDSCSFTVSPLGKVTMSLSHKEALKKVVYIGTVLRSNDFSLILDIRENLSGKAEIIVKLAASLNPILKMMASQPVTRFLETLINEMEKFRDWKKATE
jgi:hypothetical protein